MSALRVSVVKVAARALHTAREGASARQPEKTVTGVAARSRGCGVTNSRRRSRHRRTRKLVRGPRPTSAMPSGTRDAECPDDRADIGFLAGVAPDKGRVHERDNPGRARHGQRGSQPVRHRRGGVKQRLGARACPALLRPHVRGPLTRDPVARRHLACDVADDGIGPIDEPPGARILECEALECRDRPVRSRDDAHPVQVDLGEPPERIAAMRESVPQ